MIRKIWQEVSPRVYSHKAVTMAIAKKRNHMYKEKEAERARR